MPTNQAEPWESDRRRAEYWKREYGLVLPDEWPRGPAPAAGERSAWSAGSAVLPALVLGMLSAYTLVAAAAAVGLA